MSNALQGSAPSRPPLVEAGHRGWALVYGLAIAVGAGAGALFGLALTV